MSNVDGLEARNARRLAVKAAAKNAAALAELEAAATAPDPGDREPLTWPAADPEAFHGYAGRVVEAFDPYTEADPNAVLFTFLSYAGCVLGNNAHLVGGNSEHPARLWPLITGKSSQGAKGTAVAVVGQFARHATPDFWNANRASGLSTSEGLIKVIRDANGTDPEAKDFDEGVPDKRLFLVEPEFVNVLTRSRREGNSLSGTIRDAYDGGTLRTLVSGNPMRATNPHISILGMITPDELVEKLTSTDLKNGFANRFMIVASRRSKYLPDGGNTPQHVIQPLAAEFDAIVRRAARTRTMDRTAAARERWAEVYERQHRKYEQESGAIADLFARWHANTVRLSVVFALLDGRDQVDEEHVNAALAAWGYVEASTRYVFGNEESDPELGRLIEFVDNAEMGRTRADISTGLFKGNKPKKQLDDLCDRLLALGRYKVIRVPPESGHGRPRTYYVRFGGKA